tara:strand:+ start:2070 stop:9836 length:7767 start_codon:yes stop_codon:yes gene_type:complete
VQRKDWWSILKKKRDDDDDDDYSDFPEEGGMQSEEEQYQSDATGMTLEDMIDHAHLGEFGRELLDRVQSIQDRDRFRSHDDSISHDWMTRWTDLGLMNANEGDALGGGLQDMLMSVFMLGGDELGGSTRGARRYTGTDRYGRDRKYEALRHYLTLTQKLFTMPAGTYELQEALDPKTQELQEKLEALPEDAPQSARDHLERQIIAANEKWQNDMDKRERYLTDAEKSLDHLCAMMGTSFSREEMLGQLAEYYAKYVESDDLLAEAIPEEELFEAEEWERTRDLIQDDIDFQYEYMPDTPERQDIIDGFRQKLQEMEGGKYKVSRELVQEAKKRRNRLYRGLVQIYQDLRDNLIDPVLNYNNSHKSERLLARANDILDEGNLPNLWSTDLDAMYGIKSRDSTMSAGYSSYNSELFNPQHYKEAAGENPGGVFSQGLLTSAGAVERIQELALRNPALLRCHAVEDLFARLEIPDPQQRAASIQQWIAHMTDPRTRDNVLGSARLYKDQLTGSVHGLCCPECEDANHLPFIRDDASPWEGRLKNPQNDQIGMELAGAPFSTSEGVQRVIRANIRKNREVWDATARMRELEEKIRDEGTSDAERMNLLSEFKRLRENAMSEQEYSMFVQNAPELPEGELDLRRPSKFSRARRLDMEDLTAADEGVELIETRTISPDADQVRARGQTRKKPVVRNAVGLERELMQTMMKLSGEGLPEYAKEWGVIPEDEQEVLYAGQQHLANRHGMEDYTHEIAALMSQWDYVKTNLSMLENLRHPDREGEALPEFEGWDDRIIDWMSGRGKGERYSYDIFKRLQTLEEANSDNKQLKALGKEIGMKPAELRRAIKQPLLWHRMNAAILDHVSTLTSKPAQAWRKNLQALGLEEDMPEGMFGSKPVSREHASAGIVPPTAERTHTASAQEPILGFLKALDEETGKQKTVIGTKKFRVSGRTVKREVPLTKPVSWERGPLAMMWADKIKGMREPEDARLIFQGGAQRALATARAIDPESGGRVLLTDFMMNRYQREKLATQKVSESFARAPPHVKDDKFVFNENIQKMIDGNISQYTDSLKRRMENAHGQPAAHQLGYVQPYEVSPALIIALQYGFPQHMNSDTGGLMFHGAGGWPEKDGEEDYSKRDFMMQLFDFALRGGDFFQYYKGKEGEMLGPRENLEAGMTQEGFPTIVPDLIDAVINHTHDFGEWVSMFDEHEKGSGVPRGDWLPWREENQDIASLFDALRYDVLDWVVNPEAKLRQVQAQLGISIGEDEEGEDGELTPGPISIKRNEVTTRNPTGGFERCRSCAKAGYVSYQAMVVRGIASGLIKPNATKEEKDRGVLDMLNNGNAKVWGDHGAGDGEGLLGFVEQYKKEAPHLARPAQNATLSGVRFTCPDCDGLGLCAGNHPERGTKMGLSLDKSHKYARMLGQVEEYSTVDALENLSGVTGLRPTAILGESIEDYLARHPQLDPSVTLDPETAFEVSMAFNSQGSDDTRGLFIGTGDTSHSAAIDAAVASHALTEGSKIRDPNYFGEESEAMGRRYRKPEPGSKESDEVAVIRKQIQEIDSQIHSFRERALTTTERTYSRSSAVSPTGTVERKKKRGVPPAWSDQHDRLWDVERRKLEPLSAEEAMEFKKLGVLRNMLKDRLYFLNAGDTAVTAEEKAFARHQERLASFDKDVEPYEGKREEGDEYRRHEGVAEGWHPRMDYMWHGNDSNKIPMRWAVDKKKVFGVPSQWQIVGDQPHQLSYDDKTQEYIDHVRERDDLYMKILELRHRTPVEREENHDEELASLEQLWVLMGKEEEELFKKAHFHIDFETHFNETDRLMGILRDVKATPEERNQAAVDLSLMPPLSRVLTFKKRAKDGKMMPRYLIFPRLDGATPGEVLGSDYMKHHLDDDYDMGDWTAILKEMDEQTRLHSRLTNLVQPVLDLMSRHGLSSEEINAMDNEAFQKALDSAGVTDQYGAPVLGIADAGGSPLMTHVEILGPGEEFMAKYRRLKAIAEDKDRPDVERQSALDNMEEMKEGFVEGGDTQHHSGFSYHPMLGLGENAIDKIISSLGYEFVDRDGPGNRAHEFTLSDLMEPDDISDMFTVIGKPVALEDLPSITGGNHTAHSFAMALASVVLHGTTATLPGRMNPEGEGDWTSLEYGGAQMGSLDRLMAKSRNLLHTSANEIAKYMPNTLLSLLRHGKLSHFSEADRMNIERIITQMHPGLNLGGPRTDRNRWREAIPLENEAQVEQAADAQHAHLAMMNDLKTEMDIRKEELRIYEDTLNELQNADTLDHAEIVRISQMQDAANNAMEDLHDEVRELKSDWAARQATYARTGVGEFDWMGDSAQGWEGDDDEVSKYMRFVEGDWHGEDEEFAEREEEEEMDAGIVPRYYMETYMDEYGNLRNEYKRNTDFVKERERLTQAIEGAGDNEILLQFPFSKDFFAKDPANADNTPNPRTLLFSAGAASAGTIEKPVAPSRLYVSGASVPVEEWLNDEHRPHIETSPPLPPVGEGYTEAQRLADLRAAIERTHGASGPDAVPMKFAVDGDDVSPAPHQTQMTGAGPRYFHADAVAARDAREGEDDDVITLSERLWNTEDPLSVAMQILKILS